MSTALPPDLPLVPIDELLVEQVFINLLENAVRHTPPDTPIRIWASVVGSDVVVAVGDEGPGIPDGERERIFQKFHRLAPAATLDPGGGAGLGLTICRGIITAHGGMIWAESGDAPGAVFKFTLPLTGAPPHHPPEATS